MQAAIVCVWPGGRVPSALRSRCHACAHLRHHGDERGARAGSAADERFILAFWHRHLLLMPYAYRGRRISVLVSQSRDGELIARTVAPASASTPRAARAAAAASRACARCCARPRKAGTSPSRRTGRAVPPGRCSRE